MGNFKIFLLIVFVTYSSADYTERVPKPETPEARGGKAHHSGSKADKYVTELENNLKLLLKSYVYKLHHCEVEQAAKDFNSINDERIIRPLITALYKDETYTTNERKIQERIIDFLTKMSRISHLNIAFNVFMNLIKEADYKLVTPNISYVAERLQAPLDGVDQDTLSLTEIRDLDAYVHNTMIDTFARLISYNDSTAVINIMKNHSFVLEKANIVSQVVRLAFDGNLDCFKQVLDFILEIPKPEAILQGLSALIGEMKRNGYSNEEEMIALGYAVKEKLGSNDTKANATSDISKEFPQLVKNIVWKGSEGNCTFINKATQEILFVDKEVDAKSRNVFLRDAKNQTEKITWILEGVNQTATVRIKNKDSGEYLYAFDGDRVDEKRRPVYTMISGTCDEGCDWLLKPSEDGTHVHVVSEKFGEFTYADLPIEEDKRGVFTWFNGLFGINHDRALWMVQC